MVVAANEKARTIFPCGKVGIVFSVLPSLLSLSLSHPLALFRHENFTHSFNLISSAWICSDATWDARQVQCLWRWTKDRYAPCAWQTKDWKNYCAGLSSGLFSIVFRSIKAAAIFFYSFFTPPKLIYAFQCFIHNSGECERSCTLSLNRMNEFSLVV